MKPTTLLTAALALTAAISFTAQTPPPQPPPVSPTGTQQPSEIAVTLIGDPEKPPRLAIPEFIPLGNEPEVVSVAKTVGDVLWDDVAYEREFYLLPRDILRTVPRPASADHVALDRWNELGADGVVVGTVRKGPQGLVVEARVIRLPDGKMAMGKQFGGSLRSAADGGRIFAHTIADEIHLTQRNLKGVARTKLAFSSSRDGSRMKGPVGERDISNIYISDYDGANQTRMTVTRALDIAPAWAPDNSVIAYTSYRTGYPDIILQSPRALGSPTTPARGTAEHHNYLPAWSPDGTRLAFMSNRDGNPEIYVVNRDGSGLRRITTHPGNDATPTWSPTGAQLAFTSDRDGRPQVYIVNTDGTGVRRITNGQWCDRATWSAAPLNEIAYASRVGGGFEIRIFDLATNESRSITDGIGSNESPSFSPNGRHIAFTSDRSGQEQIYTIGRDGSDLRQMTKVGSNRYPSWSRQ